MRRSNPAIALFVLLVAALPAAAATGKGRTPVGIEVAVVADAGEPDPGEQVDRAGEEAIAAQRQLWLLARSLRETVAEDLQEYTRKGSDGREHPLFRVVDEPRLEQALLGAERDLPRAERDRLQRARLGLGGPAAGGPNGTLFPGWICNELQQQRSDLAVLVFLQPRGVVVKLVLARPCLLLGRKADEAITDHVKSVQNGVRELLERGYRSYLQVTGTPGLAIVVDGETIGQLPLKEPIETVPGVHELRAQRELLCDRIDKEILPGENLWAPNPCSPPTSSHLVGWIAGGATLALATTAVISHLDTLSLADEADAATERAAAIELRDQARRAAIRTDILYGAAGAALVATVLHFAFSGPASPVVVASPAADADGGASLLLTGRF